MLVKSWVSSQQQNDHFSYTEDQLSEVLLVDCFDGAPSTEFDLVFFIE